MTFSDLTTSTVPHYDKYSSRGVAVTRLILHHWAGTQGGDTRLVTPTADVSATYILYSSGELVGQVPEEFRAWTSGSPAADNPSITVETQNSTGAPGWEVSDAALEMLARLAADLCRRYEWGYLDRTRIRGHREFFATACPGPYLWDRIEWIVSRGNEILSGAAVPAVPVYECEAESMTEYFFEATSDSSPIKGESRITYGVQSIGGVTYANVWVCVAGSTHRLFDTEWKAIVAYRAANNLRPITTEKVPGNTIEQLVFVGHRAESKE